MKLIRLTSEDFERIAEKTRLKDQTREIARAVMVDGRLQADVATQYGMTRNRIKLAVQVIQKAFLAEANPGTAMIKVELEIPEILALELANLTEKIRALPDEQERTMVTTKVTKALREVSDKL